MSYFLVIFFHLSAVYSRRKESATLIKKKTKFSSYIRKFGWDRLKSHIYEEGLPFI
jgi:hypothetical protein